MKMNDLIKYACAGAAAALALQEHTEETYLDLCSWYSTLPEDIINSQLEDLQITRLQLDDMERDYMQLTGTKIC